MDSVGVVLLTRPRLSPVNMKPGFDQVGSEYFLRQYADCAPRTAVRAGSVPPKERDAPEDLSDHD